MIRNHLCIGLSINPFLRRYDEQVLITGGFSDIHDVEDTRTFKIVNVKDGTVKVGSGALIRGDFFYYN